MKTQIQGTALILFGILLVLFGMVMGDLFSLDYGFLFGLLGVLTGLVGLFFVFGKNENR